MKVRIGDKFNRLTVIGFTHRNGIKVYECTCECGSEKHVFGTASALTHDKLKSCGCLRAEAKEKVKPGMRFGRLTVLEKSKERIGKKKVIGWVCKCDCGNIKIIPSPTLLSVESRSCGCLNNETRSRLAKERWKNVWNERRHINEYKFVDSYVDVSDVKENHFFIDCCDYEKIKDSYWFVMSNGYVRNADGILLHRFIMDAPEKMVVDHIDHNPLNNRRDNLRVCTNSENSRNRALTNFESGCNGVCKNNRKTRWVATISVDGKSKNLGAFENIDDAIKTRKVAEEKYYGEFKYDKNQDYRFRDDKNEVSYG